MSAKTNWRPAIGVGYVLSFHTAIVATAQTAPVLAPLAAAEVGASASNVGYFTAIVFGAALISSNGVAGLVSRYGSFLGAATALLSAALGVVCLALAESEWMVLLGALLIGLGYGPVNPVGSRMLMRVTPKRRQNLIFSIKQSSVSIGGAVAGVVLPALALWLGWRAAMVATAAFALAAAALAFPARSVLGDDAAPEASTRFAGPFKVGAAVLRQPALRPMAIAIFTFSMTQFGFMSVYVTLLWSWMDLAPATAAAMLSVTLVASIAGRIYWGWRADAGDPNRILMMLAWSGVVVLATMLLMSPRWPFAATIALSLALGLGPLSWSGVALSEVAHIGDRLNGLEGTSRATSGIMVFGYLGGLLGPALLSLSAALAGGYGAGVAVLAVLMAGGGLTLSANHRRNRENAANET